MKMLKSTIIIAVLILSNILFSCSSDGSTSKTPLEEEINPPTKVIATLPVNGEPCSDYEEISGDDTQVSVYFSWQEAQYAQNYELVVSDGGNEVFRNLFNGLGAKVTLNRGKVYTWNVIAKNSDGQTNSDTMSFATPGTPVGNYVPYAAEIIMVFDATTADLNVSWVGEDEDGDVLSYDVVVKEEGEAIVDLKDLTTNALEATTTSPNSMYTVQVISKDGFGNFSVSEASMTSPE